MGVFWSSFRFTNNLKQPYRCIVKCGGNVFKIAIALFILGFIFLYFFWIELHGESFWKRAMAVTGIVLSSISVVLLLFSCTICIFYIRLYKAHEGNLTEISIDEIGSTGKGKRKAGGGTSKDGENTTKSASVWNSRNSGYLYPPSAPPLANNRMSPPPPVNPYKLPAWPSFEETPPGGAKSKGLSLDRNVGDTSDVNKDDKKEKMKNKTKLSF